MLVAVLVLVDENVILLAAVVVHLCPRWAYRDFKKAQVLAAESSMISKSNQRQIRGIILPVYFTRSWVVV